MKKLLLFALMLPSMVFANETQASHSVSPSLLNETVQVSGFGDIRIRRPLPDAKGFPVLLVHGVYGGASHRAYRELLPILDKAGLAVYILDLPGAGESSKPKRPYKIEDFDLFLNTFLSEIVQKRTTVVTESILSSSGLKVASDRPDLVRRLILLSPTGVNSLNLPPSEREQKLYDRLYADEAASDAFYQNLLIDNSLNYFLKFAFYDDSLVNESLLNDYRVMRDNKDQKYLTLSFVGGQLYRPFTESSRNVFVPVLGLFGKNYEGFADNQPSTAEMFKKLRPDFEYVEIENCGSSVQREQPNEVAKAIIEFHVVD
ncbi:MAG: alpha/beta fold hydrolase [Pseudobdellovibrio sp.]